MNGHQICVHPWIGLRVKTNKSLCICCDYQPDKEIPDPQCPDKGLKLDDPDLIKKLDNNPYMSQIREDILKQHYPSNCQSCLLNDQVEGMSTKTRDWIQYQDLIYEDPHLYQEGQFLNDFRPKILDLSLFNHCQLECLMCHPQFSRRLGPLYQVMGFNQSDRPPSGEPFNEQQALENLVYFLPDIQRIALQGGEPFIIPFYSKLLQKIMDLHLQDRISIAINTNLMVLDHSLMEILLKMKQVEFFISLDGTPELCQFIRYPFNQQVFENNVLYLGRLKSAGFPISLKIQSVVMACNFSHLIEFLEYLKHHPVLPRLPKFFFLTTPSYLAVNILEKSYRIEQVNKIYQYMKHDMEPLPQGALKNLDSVLESSLKGEADIKDKRIYEQYMAHLKTKRPWPY